MSHITFKLTRPTRKTSEQSENVNKANDARSAQRRATSAFNSELPKGNLSHILWRGKHLLARGDDSRLNDAIQEPQKLLLCVTGARNNSV